MALGRTSMRHQVEFLPLEVVKCSSSFSYSCPDLFPSPLPSTPTSPSSYILPSPPPPTILHLTFPPIFLLLLHPPSPPPSSYHLTSYLPPSPPQPPPPPTFSPHSHRPPTSPPLPLPVPTQGSTHPRPSLHINRHFITKPQRRVTAD